MRSIVDSPILFFVLSLVALWLAAQVGRLIARRLSPLEEEERQDVTVALTATLTLLGLIIGFSFSMVIGRYDQRKNYEEEEANAIGTEYLRADLLPAADSVRVRELLKNYLDQRILFYQTRDMSQLERISIQTAQLQNDLWAAIEATAAKQQTPTVALAVSGMNDVLNSQGYTQAAWWNRMPLTAWWLMLALAILCNLLIGLCSRRRGRIVFSTLPLALSISFFLVADISSPRQGLIRVQPQNLVTLSNSLRAH